MNNNALTVDVAIIGAGPSGMLLARLLKLNGISSALVERQSMSHVISRIRAGVLEQGSVDMMKLAEIGDRVSREGDQHTGFSITYGNDSLRIDLEKLTGKNVTVYGQTEVTKDLYKVIEQDDIPLFEETGDSTQIELNSNHVMVSGTSKGTPFSIEATFVAGCDGFHGVARKTIPHNVRKDFERVYPFGWLGILSETKPADHELIYASDDAGFALCSMRNERLSRYYVQCSTKDKVEDWSDDRFWDALRSRIPHQIAKDIETGPSIEKSIAPLRSFVCEPIQYRRLFLCGDAAHIVPPTGAKGLNLAFSDVYYLSKGLVQYFDGDDETALQNYSTTALARIWKSERFSWWMTSLLHKFDEQDSFSDRMRRAEFDFLMESEDYQRALAINYIGLPY
ncbi:MAG: 4-hydroxybenzoate 3-monooxygenase [Litorivicinaceae bacterium]